MGQRITIVDAFADRPYTGNPAAVCVLDAPADPAWMQLVAREMSLSETAFLHPVDGGWGLRWFTPRAEVALCGHATLASAHVLWTERGVADRTLRFSTKSGWLTAERRGAAIALDFPVKDLHQGPAPDGLLEALRLRGAVFLGRSAFDYLVHVADEGIVRELKPDFGAVATLPVRGVIVTAPGKEPYDFVSRFFAPAVGVDEDPVTGSAHCALAPYWGRILGKTAMTGYQASVRGGTVKVELRGDRVDLIGTAHTMVRGELAQ